MAKSTIFLQLDSDPQPSVFDAVVAIDAGIDHLLQYPNVEPTNVRQLVYGAIFTRGPKDLKHTAIFVGGSDVAVGEAIGAEIRQSFFGPMRVSVMLDGNGSNTTAAAAVLCAVEHIDLSQCNALVLGGTGPVGQRVARLLVRQGANVQVASRDLARARAVCENLSEKMNSQNRLRPISIHSTDALNAALSGCQVVVSCGAAGSTLLPESSLELASELRIAIDLNAVPPAGIEGIAPQDAGKNRGGRIDFGAIGVGGLKMKIHKASIQALVSGNELFLDCEEIFDIGKSLQEAKLS